MKDIDTSKLIDKYLKEGIDCYSKVQKGWKKATISDFFSDNKELKVKLGFEFYVKNKFSDIFMVYHIHKHTYINDIRIFLTTASVYVKR